MLVLFPLRRWGHRHFVVKREKGKAIGLIEGALPHRPREERHRDANQHNANENQ
jgi:hypothetical protein